MANNTRNNDTALFRSLKSRAAARGLSLRAACKQADVSYSTVTKWKHTVPSGIEILRKLEDVINEK